VERRAASKSHLIIWLHERRLRVALIALHLIGHSEHFQQPQDPLRVGMLEMMQGKKVRESAIGTRYKSSVSKSQDGNLSSYHSWPFALVA